MSPIKFFCQGVPKPGGSKRAFFNKKTGRAMIVDASGKKGSDWRGDLRTAASNAYHWKPLDTPLILIVTFVMPRPKGHYRTGRHADKLKPDAPHFHDKAPDSTKLVRSLEDALTKILWTDDRIIAQQAVQKVYGDKPGAHIEVRPLDAGIKASAAPDPTLLFSGAPS